MRKNSLKTICAHLPGRLRAPLERAAPFYESDAREIILRTARPLTVETADRRYYITESGVLTTKGETNGLLETSFADLLAVFKSICDYSIYARQNELNRGYITINDGVRVGVCGTAVTDRDGVIINIKDITTLSFRVACEIIGCADAVLRHTDPLGGILFCGPPCSGKTTIIRDIARVMSKRYKVSVIDERNEISATNGGKAGYDIGFSDVLVGMNKGVGVIHALRSLSPDILICDELGDRQDADMLRYALRCGAAFIATVHARELDDLLYREATAAILDTGAFRTIAVLSDRSDAGKLKAVYERRNGRYEAVVMHDDRRCVAGDRLVS